MQLALKFLVSFWREVLIALLSIALMLSISHSQALKAERDAKIAEIDFMRSAAQQYKEQSERVAKEIGDEHAAMVEQVEKNAYERAKRRFGTVARCPASGLGTRGVLPTQHGDGEAGSAGGTDVPAEEQVAVGATFITDCAFDAGTVMMWQDWARRNQLIPVTD